MAFEIEFANAHDVTWECVAAAVELVMQECPGELIELMLFGDDWIEIERYGRPRKVIDFPVRRYERIGEQSHAS